MSLAEKKLREMPKRVRMIRSQADAVRHLNRIYSEARRGLISQKELDNYGRHITRISEILKGHDLERRVELLEEDEHGN